MTTDIRMNDSRTIAKKIKLNNDYEAENKGKIKSVKLEPMMSGGYLSPVNRSKDILLKVYPIINVSEESKNSHKPVQFLVTNISNLNTKSENIEIKLNEGYRTTKSHQDNVANIRPSEALFVRSILPHCKRLAPLWFKGVSSMREKNREEHRRISASAACASQNEWEIISDMISEMNESTETETVVNLLKKLYKELPADMVLWFIKCWLKFQETVDNDGKCVLSRGDVRGRMRRIDGGKGSDKVWRLDTIVGMMFHGMPMSSTDTNIMVHTCDQELCIRPQHLRFKASAVAFVAVLKALQQTGYSIIPPADDGYSARRTSPCDEFVDLSGPFRIEQLQKYRLEELKPYEQSMGKLNSNSSDISLLETYPVLKNYYPSYIDNLHNVMLDYKSKTSSCYNVLGLANDLKRPAQTTSNSTGSPPQVSDGNSHQCQSPPNLTNKQSLNTEIAPTPRHIGSFKTLEDSPSSSSIFSNGRDCFGKAPDLLPEGQIDVKLTTSIDTLSTISRITNESPVISGSNNGSGKNTPRQPAKKRLEARTPRSFVEDQMESFSSVSSPMDNKPCPSSNSISAFRIVSKKNLKNETKPSDELTEVEVAEILDPCSSFEKGNYHSNGHFLSESMEGDNKCIPNGTSSDTMQLGNSSENKRANDSLTTPSPFDYLFMAISQNHNNTSEHDDPMFPSEQHICPSVSNDPAKVSKADAPTMICPKPLKSSSSTLSCRFTPEQASVLLNAIRDSPYGNNNPEIIDMLFNMMQQYPCMGDGHNGDHSYRPDSRLLRKHIYQQLSKASPSFDNYSLTPTLTDIQLEDSTHRRSSPLSKKCV